MVVEEVVLVPIIEMMQFQSLTQLLIKSLLVQVEELVKDLLQYQITNLHKMVLHLYLVQDPWLVLVVVGVVMVVLQHQ